MCEFCPITAEEHCNMCDPYDRPALEAHGHAAAAAGKKLSLAIAEIIPVIGSPSAEQVQAVIDGHCAYHLDHWADAEAERFAKTLEGEDVPANPEAPF